jgi:hypothetical protein
MLSGILLAIKAVGMGCIMYSVNLGLIEYRKMKEKENEIAISNVEGAMVKKPRRRM